MARFAADHNWRCPSARVASRLATSTGDCHADVVTASSRVNLPGGAIAIRYGTGDGTFFELPVTAVDRGGHSGTVTHGDLNADGHVDLVMGNGTLVRTALGNGDGTFRPVPEVAHVRSSLILAAGDFNGDSHLDVAAGGTMLLGHGDGTFEAISPSRRSFGNALAAADFNADGNRPVAKHHRGATAYLGAGDGTFQAVVLIPPSSVGDGESGLAVAGFNGDGHLDIAAGCRSEGGNTAICIVFGNGDGTFDAPVITPDDRGHENEDLRVGDFNGDGLADLVTLARARGNTPVRLLLGNGDGTFKPAIVYQAPFGVEEIHVADVNGDQKADVVARGRQRLSGSWAAMETARCRCS